MKPLRIGTRGSPLALWQARSIGEALRSIAGVESEIVIVKTSGDKFQQTSFSDIGTKGVFIKELEDALLDRRVDLAVHSMKDVPTEIPAGLTIAAICKRQDVRDALLSTSGTPLDRLPAGARVGTSSLRRKSQLLYARRDLQILDLRGNVETRIEKLKRGDYDAIVLAKAGLDRLGLSAETCSGVEAERAVLAGLEGGCQVSIGAWGRVESGKLELEVAVLSPDGAQRMRENISGAPQEAVSLGGRLAAKMLEQGAAALLAREGRGTRA